MASGSLKSKASHYLGQRRAGQHSQRPFFVGQRGKNPLRVVRQQLGCGGALTEQLIWWCWISPAQREFVQESLKLVASIVGGLRQSPAQCFDELVGYVGLGVPEV